GRDNESHRTTELLFAIRRRSRDGSRITPPSIRLSRQEVKVLTGPGRGYIGHRRFRSHSDLCQKCTHVIAQSGIEFLFIFAFQILHTIIFSGPKGGSPPAPLPRGVPTPLRGVPKVWLTCQGTRGFRPPGGCPGGNPGGQGGYPTLGSEWDLKRR